MKKERCIVEKREGQQMRAAEEASVVKPEVTSKGTVALLIVDWKHR